MLPERRRQPRCPPMAAYFLSCHASERPSGPSLASWLLNVCPGGVCVSTSERLPLGLRMVIEIRFPGEVDRFRAQAVVAWSGERAAGLRFDSVDEDADLPAPEVDRPAAEPRRRQKRFFPGRADVEFSAETFWTSLGFRPRNRALRLVDLSLGGAHLVCGERIEAGARGRLRLDFSYPRLELVGETQVVWCRRDTLRLTPEWHVGLSFRRVADPAALRSLARGFLG